MKPQLVFNKGQRVGVFLLVLAVIGLLITSFWVKQQSNQSTENQKQRNKTVRVQHYIDSLKQIKQVDDEYEIYPFNPNFITDYKGYMLGMSPDEIDRLHAFRAKNKWINTVAAFQEVTGVSDSLLNAISPYFDFPDWVVEERKQRRQEQRQQAHMPTYAEKTDLNNVTREQLKAIKGIGAVLSRRIIRYRKQLHGFVADIQLKDVYGLDYEVQKRILKNYTVKSHQIDEKLDLKTASVAELTEIPYFDYELARDMVNYRITHQGITSFEELSKIEDFPYWKMDRIKLYLKI